ncbi:AbrB/MazE/SpoVT family DNA-binding domain-containing protein [Streptococcus oricebi]|uniref:AbrB family transcriptional regulator n=1 Tax=Streptococcus oricebi TaxID=1547447 RepID=A0ABS5B622_9STRE|nr:AbrB/MazE/SpoVT family DNA-binding domain-containing protein [Streptococcus oricebi]MBP2624294.1 AbrB family transcriptional regulator [Streptococcus oricebi]
MDTKDMKTGKDKYIGSVKIGPKGQIVIPKEVRDMFDIKSGDTLVLLADSKQGIAVQKYEAYEKVFEQIFKQEDKAE